MEGGRETGREADGEGGRQVGREMGEVSNGSQVGLETY